jgi:putative intracellular protease/amidase
LNLLIGPSGVGGDGGTFAPALRWPAAAGPFTKPAGVVVDGHVITSRKPDDLPAVVVAVMKALAGG